MIFRSAVKVVKFFFQLYNGERFNLLFVYIKYARNLRDLRKIILLFKRLIFRKWYRIIFPQDQDIGSYMRKLT